MIKSPKHIEIVRTTALKLSSLSIVSSNAIYNVLSSKYTKVSVTEVNNEADLRELAHRNPDLAFMGLRVLPDESGQDIWISAYLESKGINHTGSSCQALQFELNKGKAKKQVLDAGLKSSRFHLINNTPGYTIDRIGLKFPLFVKPDAGGGGFGIDSQSVVYNLEGLNSKLASLAELRPSKVIIEEYLPGREFSVAVLKDARNNQLRVLPIELVVSADKNGHRILGQQEKSQNKETVSVISDLVTKQKVTRLAKNAFIALGGRDYGRIDIRLDAMGEPNFIEANFIPSLIEDYGSFPKACQLNIGLSYENLIIEITELGLSRKANSISIDSTKSPLLFPATPVPVF